MPRPLQTTRPFLAAGVLAALLAGCGGGGDDPADGGDALRSEIAQSASANGMAIADDGVRAQASLVHTARWVIANGHARLPVECAGGGAAYFTASGGSTGSLFNGRLDAGESYSIDFADCRSSSDSARVTGSLSLGVISANGPDYTVSTDADVVITLPQRTLHLDGQSTLAHTERTTGDTQVVTDRWTTSFVGTTSARHGRSTSLRLSSVDLTQTVTTTDGVATDSHNEGSFTMAYGGRLGNWSATITTDGAVRFGVDGLPAAGLWRIALPHDVLALEVIGGFAIALLDIGGNGIVDSQFRWGVPMLWAQAD